MVQPSQASRRDDGAGGLLSQARQKIDQGEPQAAEQEIRRLLSANRNDPNAHRLLGAALHAQDRVAEAITSYQEAARLDPNDGRTFRRLARLLGDYGRLSEALAAARRALELRPGDVKALALLTQLSKPTPPDLDLPMWEALADDPNALDEEDRIRLLFTLAAIHESLGNYQHSFSYLRQANAEDRARHDYDVEADISFFEQIAAAFDHDLFQRLDGAGSASEIPVLVVGMPRSGTTLVEQILASHPAVHGAGELPSLAQVADAIPLLGTTSEGFPHGVRSLNREDFQRLGEGYARRLARLAPAARRVVDKQNGNYHYLGLARLIVPRAKVIHCQRDPLATCFSCYAVHFEAVKFTRDLVELGRYYCAYSELMAHWRRILPTDWLLEVSYEELVHDPEPWVRRIVAHVGLDWDDACLSSHMTQRDVRTASFAQVRRPIYSDSVARWRPFVRYLEPLRQTLDTLHPVPEDR